MHRLTFDTGQRRVLLLVLFELVFIIKVNNFNEAQQVDIASSDYNYYNVSTLLWSNLAIMAHRTN
jgi:hypothetical protein